MTQMKASIIIPTYNGAHKISILLKSLLRQDTSDFEVIIIIDGSIDNTVEIVKTFVPAFPKAQIIMQSNSGRSRVRNRGAERASGEILIFYDDDMEPTHDSVSRHIYFHEKYQGILGGNQIEERGAKKTDIQNYKATRNEIWMSKYANGLTRLDHSNLFFTAANCSMKRETFFAMNGFDERLSDAEDYDLAYRALQKGIDVFFDKSNRAYHHDPITARSYIQRLRQYSRAHAMLQAFHPERKTSQRRSFFVKRIIYSSLALRFWVRLIDEGFLKSRLLPESARFKLYDLIIQAMAVEYPNRSL